MSTFKYFEGSENQAIYPFINYNVGGLLLKLAASFLGVFLGFSSVFTLAVGVGLGAAPAGIVYYVLMATGPCIIDNNLVLFS